MSIRCKLAVALLVAVCSLLPRSAVAQPARAKPSYATRADLDRLEKKLDEQQRLLGRLVVLQEQYMKAITMLLKDLGAPPPTTLTPPAAVAPAPSPPAPAPAPVPPPTLASPAPATPALAPAKVPATAAKPAVAKMGSVVGRVTGGTPGSNYIYIEDLRGTAAKGTAAMKQENKQFVPRVLVVPVGTEVSFPNMDAEFHNVFSPTPDYAFDLGSYRQGQSRSVKMTKSGVVTVFCNIHPKMVGHILVVPSSLVVVAGKDGFFRLSGVPVGRRRVVAWGPNTKPAVAEIEIADAEATTVELALGQGRTQPHEKKNGLPYGSYGD
jgi:plastocyanin